MSEKKEARPGAGRPVRPIDTRHMPGVKGVDLAQALNYIELEKVGREFIYDHYTATRLTYVPGSRPRLEELAARITRGLAAPLEKVQAVTRFVAKEMPWAGYHEKKTGQRLPTGRNLPEEDLIESGFGWCNEQARVFCVLNQVLGIPSRMVFAGNNEKKFGHVASKVYLPEGWMLVDQSMDFCFIMDGRPVRACDVWHVPGIRAYFEPLYLEAGKKVKEELGEEVLKTSFGMLMSENPLEGFKDLGYLNHFI